jgi:hypothetical protein
MLSHRVTGQFGGTGHVTSWCSSPDICLMTTFISVGRLALGLSVKSVGCYGEV